MCKCNTPQNPDELIVSCSSATCRKWLHTKCLANDAARRAGESHTTPPLFQSFLLTSPAGAEDTTTRKKKGHQKRKSKVTTPTFSPNSSAVAIAKSPNGTHTAELFIKGQPDRATAEPAERDEIVVTDAEGRTRTEEVKCLFCNSQLE
jgi:hypothetical protein